MLTMTKKRNSFSKRIRLVFQDFGHVLLGVCTLTAALVLAPYAFKLMIENGWNYAAIYSSVFDVATVFTALLFAFVVYFRTSKSEYLSALPKRLLDQATAFSQRAFWWGMGLILISVPLIVIEPAPVEAFGAFSALVAVWVGIAATAASAFWQASSIFWIIVSGDR
ncbi:hypothetical protein [Henriciella barbarensis]|nr:hypothetical protein [Henriciella barbarensis]